MSLLNGKRLNSIGAGASGPPHPVGRKERANQKQLSLGGFPPLDPLYRVEFIAQHTFCDMSSRNVANMWGCTTYSNYFNFKEFKRPRLREIGAPPISLRRGCPRYLSDFSHFAHPPICMVATVPLIVADLHALRPVGRGAIEPDIFTGRPRLSYTFGHLPSQMLGQMASLPQCPLATGSRWGMVGACCHACLTFSGGLGGYQGLTAPQKPHHPGT